jgi:hypothetical protein
LSDAAVWVSKENTLLEFNDINLNDCWLGGAIPHFRQHRFEPTRQRIEKPLERIPLPASRRRQEAPTLCPRAPDCEKPHPWRVSSAAAKGISGLIA